jgi:hypothetical protein
LLIFNIIIIRSVNNTEKLYLAIFTIINYKNQELWLVNDYKKVKRSFFIIEIAAVFSLVTLHQNLGHNIDVKNLVLWIMAFGILWYTVAKGMLDYFRFQYIDKGIESMIQNENK